MDYTKIIEKRIDSLPGDFLDKDDIECLKQIAVDLEVPVDNLTVAIPASKQGLIRGALSSISSKIEEYYTAATRLKEDLYASEYEKLLGEQTKYKLTNEMASNKIRNIPEYKEAIIEVEKLKIITNYLKELQGALIDRGFSITHISSENTQDRKDNNY